MGREVGFPWENGQLPTYQGAAATGFAVGRAIPAAPFGHGRRPQPWLLRRRFRFCPAAITWAWILTFSRPRSRKRRKPAPVLRLREQRFDPHLPLPHRLRVVLCFVVAAHPVQIGFIEVAADSPSPR